VEQLYAKIGRMQVDHEALDAEYSRLLALLAQVVAGEVDPSRLLVNLSERSWQLAAPGERPPAPATINGLPVVVVAPPPPSPEELLRRGGELAVAMSERAKCNGD